MTLFMIGASHTFSPALLSAIRYGLGANAALITREEEELRAATLTADEMLGISMR